LAGQSTFHSNQVEIRPARAARRLEEADLLLTADD
jgi:hypothetical protein